MLRSDSESQSQVYHCFLLDGSADCIALFVGG